MPCPAAFRLMAAMAVLSCVAVVRAQQPSGAPAVNSASVAAGRDVLDRVIAVVNNRAILASDVAEETRLSVLEPDTGQQGETPASALQRLISRTLIQQQIRQEDAAADEPSEKEMNDRIAQLRQHLPACARANCASDAGWTAFLNEHGLTALDVQNYVRSRTEILGFIENRFRAGNRIAPEDIERYYRETLLPQYAPGAAVPALSAVSSRIQEILLQQQVNALFSAWLDNLRKQGDVEILDPAYETVPATPASGEKGQ